MNDPKFKIGDSVWIPRFNMVDKPVVCPDCLGRKALTVIMGDDSKVSIECTGCSQGYDPARGYIVLHEWKPTIEPTTVDTIKLNGDGWLYSGNRFYEQPESGVFATDAEAMARAVEMGKAHEADELDRLENRKENTRRTWAWNATYHRRELKEAQRRVEYHSSKLNVAKAKAKEPEPATTEPHAR